MWKYRGRERPDFAVEPGEEQESVWDYPRPPRLEQDNRLVEVFFNSTRIASSCRALRMLETASPPTFYIPKEDVRTEQLIPVPGSSYCEWKGKASYWALRDNRGMGSVGWSYAKPNTPYEELKDHFSFYPSLLDCFVDGERVQPQPGSFYGGWITKEIVGPVKGEPGTGHW